MNVVKEIQRINQKEITNGTWSDTGSWHAQYRNSAWIFAGNMPFDLTEGDVVCIFSQYGEIIHVELIRDHKTGKSKGFAFIQYEDQRSTILAVDNLNGADVLGRTLRVDHSHTGPRKQKKKDGEEESDDDQPKMNVAPQLIEVGKEKSKPKKADLDEEEDPMAAYFREKKEKKSKKKDKSNKHHKHKRNKEDESEDKGDRSPEKRPSRYDSRSYRDDDHGSRSYRDNDRESRSYRNNDRERRSYRDDRSPRRRSRSPTRRRSRSPTRRRSRSRSISPRRRSYSPSRS